MFLIDFHFWECFWSSKLNKKSLPKTRKFCLLKIFSIRCNFIACISLSKYCFFLMRKLNVLFSILYFFSNLNHCQSSCITSLKFFFYKSKIKYVLLCLIDIFKKSERLYIQQTWQNAKWLNEPDNQTTVHELRTMSICSVRRVLLILPPFFPQWHVTILHMHMRVFLHPFQLSVTNTLSFPSTFEQNTVEKIKIKFVKKKDCMILDIK